jgi:hypothetical protein
MKAALGLLAVIAVVVVMTCETAPVPPVVSRQKRLARFDMSLASGHGYNLVNFFFTLDPPTSIPVLPNGSTLTSHMTTSPIPDLYAHTSKGVDCG